jgi:hypothetical protein
MLVSFGYSGSIKKRINMASEGTIFINSDFADIADPETIRRNLNRLVSGLIVRRLLHGIYEKPKYSDLLEEYVAASPQDVAFAIARCFHWTIAPCGNTALNQLGLSAQVTAVWSYISDGPYKMYDLGKTRIEFKHRTNKEVSGLSYKTASVIQALKVLGKENADDAVIEKLRVRLTKEEKDVMLIEAAESTDWIYKIIKKICGANNINDADSKIS